MTGPVLITFTTIVLVAVTGVLLAVRLTVRTGGLSPSLVTPTEPEAEYEPAPYQAPPQRQRKTSTARGIRPPASPGLLPMMITAECSGGACALCPRNGCEHDCLHDPAIIVARNTAEYDRTHGKVPA